MAFHKMEGELSSSHPHTGHKSCPCCCWLHACGHPMQQLVPVALGGKGAGAGGGGCLGLAGPRSYSCCCQAAEVCEGGELWDSALVTLQLGLELGKGHRVSFTCFYLFMLINQRSGRQTPKG